VNLLRPRRNCGSGAKTAEETIVTTVPRHLVEGERVGFHSGVEPKDAATLIIIDQAGDEPKVLLGRRHARHVFLPGKFVFPGGRVDDTDRAMQAAMPLHLDTERKLLADSRFQSAKDAQALALAAIRETFEETGLVIGAKGAAKGSVPSGAWSKFVRTGFYPDPSLLQFIARAITPPGFERRFDARFFCVDGGAIAHRLENIIHPDAELVELTWLPIAAARRLDLPVITGLVLEELQSLLRADLRHDLPVPFYTTRNGEFTRDLIE
jgi:8-oxo-dGTP pyrophosphatase MutT (NUDIX family)